MMNVILLLAKGKRGAPQKSFILEEQYARKYNYRATENELTLLNNSYWLVGWFYPCLRTKAENMPLFPSLPFPRKKKERESGEEEM